MTEFFRTCLPGIEKIHSKSATSDPKSISANVKAIDAIRSIGQSIDAVDKGPGVMIVSHHPGGWVVKFGGRRHVTRDAAG